MITFEVSMKDVCEFTLDMPVLRQSKRAMIVPWEKLFPGYGWLEVLRCVWWKVQVFVG